MLHVLAEVAKVVIKQLVFALPYDPLSLEIYELMSNMGDLGGYYLL